MLSVCFSCLPCWLAEKSLSFSNGLDLKESLSDIWIFFLPFLDKMDIFENDCVCSSNLRVWGICKEFYYSLFCWENWWEWEWDINQAYPGEWWCLLVKPAVVIPSRCSFIQERHQIHPKYEWLSIYPLRDASATWKSWKELHFSDGEPGITF